MPVENLVNEFSKRTGFTRVCAVPIETDAASFLQAVQAGQADEPRVLRGHCASWPAVALWDEEYLLSRCGDVLVCPSVGLPKHGVPYLVTTRQARRQMRFSEFWREHLTKEGYCYVDQQSLAQLPELLADVNMSGLVNGGAHGVPNLWLGIGTKSGLHFDPRDNFVVMIRGTKLVALAAPNEAPRLYPFLDTISKSQLDVEAPNFRRFRRSSRVMMWVSELEAGDVLYIPIAWWHYLSSPTDRYSISLNYWFGRSTSEARKLRYVLRLGPRYVARFLRDFAVHGVLAKPFERRSFSPPPAGVIAYETFRKASAQARRRLTD